MRKRFAVWFKSEGWILFTAIIIFLFLRLWQLVFLPIFADEAIYLRWSQLIMQEPMRYLFFPLNDGKTPLQMWLSIPFLMFCKDPLFAGRLLSVLAGLGQMIVVWSILTKLKSKKLTKIIGMCFCILLPWWFFHQRLALIDSLLTFWFSLLIYFLLDVSATSVWRVKSIVAAALCFGLALWTKIPAILFLPTIFLLIFNLKDFHRSLTKIALISGGGLLMFISLKFLSPAFTQLFSRSGDFLEFTDISGALRNLTVHSSEFLVMNNKYLTFGLVALFFIEVVFMLAHCVRRANPTIFTASSTSPWWLFFLSSAGFFLPIILFGSTMTYSRYYLPSLLPLMLALLLGIDAIFVLPPKKSFSLLKAIVIGCLIAALTQSTLFVYRSYAHLAALDLDKLDKVQYLEEWSSGFGISEVLATAENKASPDHKILLISEGSFGTPTDALNLYLLAARDSNVAVEGIGWQIHNIPQSALDRAANEYDETWLVVNSHRLFMTMPEQKPLLNIPRPNPAAPTLQVWRIM